MLSKVILNYWLMYQLLWKVADSAYTQKDFNTSVKWLNLCRSDIFVSEDTNGGKLLRRLILCHLELGDVAAARSLLSLIPQSELESARTQYLSFKTNTSIASDQELMQIATNIIACKDFKMTILYHCAVEATNAKRQKLSQFLLELIYEQSQRHERMSNLTLPVLLRCVIRLSKHELEDGSDCNERLLESLCINFEMAAKLVTTEASQLKNGFNVRELTWFSQNAHNFAITGATHWPTKFILRLLACTKLVSSGMPATLLRPLLSQ